MASRNDILETLNILVSAYPDKKLPEATLQLYLSSLVDLPADQLRLAAHEHIQVSPWFPRIADLRRIAARETGSADTEQASHDPRTLYAAERDLMAAFARGEDLDEDAWISLIKAYELIGFEECAQRSRQRLAHYRGVVEQEIRDQAIRESGDMGGGELGAAKQTSNLS